MPVPLIQPYSSKIIESIETEDIEAVLTENKIPQREHENFSSQQLLTQSTSETGNQNFGAAINENERMRKSLIRQGASVDNAARTITNVMHAGKSDSSKLRAAEIVLDLHGVRNKDGAVNKQPIFQFFIKDSSVNLNQVFAPVRQTLAEIENQENSETNSDV